MLLFRTTYDYIEKRIAIRDVFSRVVTYHYEIPQKTLYYIIT